MCMDQTRAVLGLKVKVRGQGQTAKIKVKGRNGVGETSILKQGQLVSTVVCSHMGADDQIIFVLRSSKEHY